MAIIPVLLNVCLSDSPSPSPIPPLYRQDPGALDWTERVETHPFAAEEESELGYMDDTYQEEPYEDLLTPEFIGSERDTLWMVEVLPVFVSYVSLFLSVSDVLIICIDDVSNFSCSFMLCSCNFSAFFLFEVLFPFL